jgi:hypothetical protein
LTPALRGGERKYKSKQTYEIPRVLVRRFTQFSIAEAKAPFRAGGKNVTFRNTFYYNRFFISLSTHIPKRWTRRMAATVVIAITAFSFSVRGDGYPLKALCYKKLLALDYPALLVLRVHLLLDN